MTGATPDQDYRLAEAAAVNAMASGSRHNTMSADRDRALPVRHGAASRYVRNSPEPLAARADIDSMALLVAGSAHSLSE